MKLISVAMLAAMLQLGIGTPAHAQTQVVVVNPPEDAVNVVPVADRIPYIRTYSITGDAGDQSYVTELAFLGVPAGFRLIIEVIGVELDVPSSQRAAVVGLPANRGVAADIRIPLPIEHQITFFSGVLPLAEKLYGSVGVRVPVESDQILSMLVTRSR